ncbi:MAG: hypothetical protein B7733_09460 [Myxococcales bacterium FL481]|nr:MAG: hypothetical protein B7733_09460 [Myxococcales bacterium FL481]
MTKTLFAPVVAPEKLNAQYNMVRTDAAREPARRMIDDVFSTFEDKDGNFVQQFQTDGFNSRFFELYLHAYFERSGYMRDESFSAPDFIVSRNGVRVAVEATTSNPSSSPNIAEHGREISELSDVEVPDYVNNEIPIRLGSPLRSKLDKRYWEKSQCEGCPFVIAIQAFHDENALVFSSAALTRFLYGIEYAPVWSDEGDVRVRVASVPEHVLGSKTLSPGLFRSDPAWRHVSAILFTNNGALGKFSRMGYQTGLGCEGIKMQRFGWRYNAEPQAMDPSFFAYDMACPPFVETWGEGLDVLHNPVAEIPLPPDFFVDATQVHERDGKIYSEGCSWKETISSKTVSAYFGDALGHAREILAPFPFDIEVGAVSRAEFDEISGRQGSPLGIREEGWFADKTRSFLGVLVPDLSDSTWGWVVLARDSLGRFRCIKSGADLAERGIACEHVQQAIIGLLNQPQRIFPQDDC